MFEKFKKLPHSNTLFKRYFDRWYNKEDQRGIPRPDMFTIAAYSDTPLDIDSLQYLTSEWLDRIKKQVAGMIEAAKNDFQFIISFDDFSINILDEIDKHYSRRIVTQLIKESDPSEYSNKYLVTVCMFGSMIGELFSRHENFKWLYSYPYFNSIIVYSEKGLGIPVYDWAVKKFSSYGINDGFAAKFQHAINEVKGNDSTGFSISTYKTI
jgi:hypothetical protein